MIINPYIFLIPWYPGTPLNDPLTLVVLVTGFEYTPAGVVPVGAYNDTLNLTTSVVNFSYA